MPDQKDIQRETPSQASQTKRTIHDRNSDQTIGSPKVHVPHKGNERANSLRTPETFLGPIADGGWDGRGVPSGGTSYRPASASGVGSGSGPAQSSLDAQGLFRKGIRLKGPSAGQMLMKAIDRESGKAGGNDPRIRTSFVHPPIPSRSYDWAAWIDGQEEGVTGRGPTESAAVAELLDLIPQSAPKYSLKTQLWVGAWIFLSIASGVALGFMKGCR